MSSPARNAIWPELLPKAVALRQQGKTNTEIAAALGTSYQNIHYWMGPSPNSQRPHRFGLHERAYYLRECGYPIREIADQIGVPRATVGDWLRGMKCR